MASIATCYSVSPKYHFQTYSVFPLKPSPLSSRIHHAVAFPSTKSKGMKKALVPSVRAASIDLSNAVRPGGVVESEKLSSDVRKRAMEAVDSYGERVTVGDVASRAGLKLDEAQKALQSLAADADGFLEVSDEGDVLYVFPKDYRSKLAGKSFWIKVEPIINKTKDVAEYLVRVSFGTTLIASIVIVYTAIIALLLSSKSDSDSDSDDDDDGGILSLFFRSTDLFRYCDPSNRRRVQTDDGDKFNFVESVFSFVFGDGDPNEGIEEERWKSIGRYIASNGGVVSAEELAPYLDVPSTESDESYVLPVLLRFDGQPEVDEEGNILYRFPSLQRTATSAKIWGDWVGGVQKFFEEKKWELSKTSGFEKALVIGLGGVNLFGVVVLGAMLQQISVPLSGFILFVADIFPLLQVYAASFFAIPLIRWFLIRKKNADIEKRNKMRQHCARALELPDLSLRRKLLSARDMAQRTVIGKDRIVYSTNKDLLEQDMETQEWDQRFRDIKKSY